MDLPIEELLFLKVIKQQIELFNFWVNPNLCIFLIILWIIKFLNESCYKMLVTCYEFKRLILKLVDEKQSAFQSELI